MIILDTNVVSEPSKLRPNPNVVAWFDRQTQTSLFLTAISSAELKAGIAFLPQGKRKENLQHILDDALAKFVTPILAFDGEAATAYALVVARARLDGIRCQWRMRRLRRSRRCMDFRWRRGMLSRLWRLGWMWLILGKISG